MGIIWRLETNGAAVGVKPDPPAISSLWICCRWLDSCLSRGICNFKTPKLIMTFPILENSTMNTENHQNTDK